MNPSKIPDTSFEIRLVGSGLYPEKVPARLLGTIISAVQVLANGNDALDSSIRLLKVKRGSARYALVSDHAVQVVKNLQKAGAAVRDENSLHLEYYMLGAFQKLNQIAKSLQCEVEICLPNETWSFSEEDYSRIRGGVTVTDEATISGELVRVGGATARKCSIRPHGESRILYCRVDNAELSRKLGRHLYHDVVLSGWGIRFAKTWDLIKMFVKSAYFPSNDNSISDFVREVRALSGTGWDVPDPGAELEKYR